MKKLSEYFKIEETDDGWFRLYLRSASGFSLFDEYETKEHAEKCQRVISNAMMHYKNDWIRDHG